MPVDLLYLNLKQLRSLLTLKFDFIWLRNDKKKYVMYTMHNVQYTNMSQHTSRDSVY